MEVAETRCAGQLVRAGQRHGVEGSAGHGAVRPRHAAQLPEARAAAWIAGNEPRPSRGGRHLPLVAAGSSG
eukprot:4851853-Pyramimonas_sp.AAC.1